MFAKPIRITSIIISLFYVCSCAENNSNHFASINEDSSKRAISNVAAANSHSASASSIVLYDKNQLPQVIKDYYSEKWEGFEIANPDEEWDAGCCRGVGIVDSVGKNGIRYQRIIQFSPNKQLVSITVDTASGTYLVTYDQGGIARTTYSDYFKVLKDGSLEVNSNSK